MDTEGSALTRRQPSVILTLEGHYCQFRDDHLHHVFQTCLKGGLSVGLLLDVLVMGKVLESSMMRRVVPTDLQPIVSGKLIVAVSFENVAFPLLRHT